MQAPAIPVFSRNPGADLALPEDYATVLAGLKQRVREARFRAQRQVNTELIRLMRREAHAATVGLLLCTDKNDRVVRYALAGSNQPIAIASYDLLPTAEQAVLPSEADLQRALDER